MALTDLLKLKRIVGATACASAAFSVVLTAWTLFVTWEMGIYMSRCPSISLTDGEPVCRSAAYRILRIGVPAAWSMDVTCIVVVLYLAINLRERIAKRKDGLDEQA